MKKIIVNFLPFAVAVTFLCGLVYIAVQQDLRLSANDPQIGIAEDTARLLDAGADLRAVVPGSSVDVATSVGTFVSVYDDKNLLVASSLSDQSLIPPAGVFEYARTHTEDVLTWQPKPGIRIAAVMVHHASGFVLVGRSLREVEMRERALLRDVLFAWIITLIALFGSVWMKETA